MCCVSAGGLGIPVSGTLGFRDVEFSLGFGVKGIRVPIVDYLGFRKRFYWLGVGEICEYFSNIPHAILTVYLWVPTALYFE